MNLFKTLFVVVSLLIGGAFAAEPVNVNTANAEELAQALDGVGLKKAEAIIEYREQNGPFQHSDELVSVKGIGLKTVDRNRDSIRFSDQAPAQTSRKGS